LAGHDINYISVTGVLAAIGAEGATPTPPLNLLGDFGGGSMYLLAGILMALHERERSGRGQTVDAAIVDGVASLSGYIQGMRALGTWRDERGVNRLDGGAPFYGVYETADGRWVAVGAVEGQFWAELVEILELKDLPPQADRSRWPEVRERVRKRILEKTRDEWVLLASGRDACMTPVLTWSEAASNEHLVARGSLLDQGGSCQPGIAPRLWRTPGQVPEPGVWLNRIGGPDDLDQVWAARP
jgi:alpha-methylacyl-CoA racemase